MLELAPGMEFAGYRLEGVAGRGGMGVVYRATELALDRTVAVKVMAPWLIEDEAAHRRFVRESRLAASIEHAFRHEDEAVEYALGFGRGLDREKARRFVLMYVNEYTRDMGEEGRRALETLLGRAAEAGLVPPVSPIELI